MKKLATMTAVAALLAGVSFANAQNTVGPAGSTASPSNLNAMPNDGGGKSQSGMETKGAAQMKGKSTTTGQATNPTVSPSDPNAKPQDGDAKTKSGMQSKGSQMAPGGTATTGAGSPNTAPKATSPADPNAKQPTAR